MRVPVPVPETERGALRPLFQKVLEIAGIVCVGDSFRTAPVEVSIVCGAGRIRFAPGGFPIRRAAPFAGKADVITLRSEHVGIDLQAAGPRRMVHRGFLEAIKRHAGQNRRTGRIAGWDRDKGIGEKHAFPGHAVEIWCLDHLAAVSAGVKPGLIVGDTKQDVRSFR